MSSLPDPSLIADALLPLIARAAVAMLLTMLVVRGLLWLLAIRSPHLHRWSSLLVLAQGWLIAPLVISIPWYDPPTTTTAPVTAAANIELPPVDATPRTEQQTAAIDNSLHRHEPVATAPALDLAELLPFIRRSLATIWLCGVSGLLLLAVALYGRHCRQAAYHHRLDSTTAAQWQALLQQTQGPPQLPLRLTTAIGPLLCLLPRGYEVWVPQRFWLACTTAEQAAIVRHELSHYRRGDLWKSWLVYALALPQWFNPAAWWAVRNFLQAGEWLCDLEAAGSPPQRAEYLQALLRLVELQPPRTTVAGQCAHAHPLLVRVRRLLSPSLCQDSSMNKVIICGALLVAAVVPLVRLEFVARAAEPPAALVAVKDRMQTMDGQLAKVKEAVEALKERGSEIKTSIDSKVSDLKKLAENKDQLSEELKAKAQVFMTGDEQAQLGIVKEIDKLASQDEQVLALGRMAKDSPHETVRRAALLAALAKGEAGYPAVALAFEALNSKDRGFLAQELNKQTSTDKLLMFVAMMKNADDELTQTLLGLELPTSQRLIFLGALADSRKDDEKFAAQVMELADKTTGDGGLLILYAAAKVGSGKVVAEAVKLAVKRKQDAWPVLAAAYKKEDKESRAAVVRAAKELGGEGGDFLVKTALEESNEELRTAAEEAVK
ncbi:BlaR1 peptidase M56 [Anatilimnocola aggregata]|uniref:BlaR1 peptidase M56 n=1 Tax=Anatilimnocola aggregata TaxID=2528021 RepID=A0A517YJQ0_9BACT|nr:M56 family metallopeptidase [Anatilimnocola aggregata]QDU30454.1 BlaR1 peptidase M56 [Anatilimnocola aggregata]